MNDWHDMNLDGCDNLAVGIIKQAITDYQSNLRQIKKYKNSYAARAEIVALRRFFRSQWFEMLCSVPGETFIKLLEDGFDIDF